MYSGDREILDHFRTTRQRTIELLDTVPGQCLTRTADGEATPLGWLFMHVAGAPDWWMTYCMRDGGAWRRPGDAPADKDSIHAALESSLARVLDFFERDDGAPMDQVFHLVPDKHEAPGAWTGRNRVLYLADHEVHHRGKIVLSLRQCGVDDLPPMP